MYEARPSAAERPLPPSRAAVAALGSVVMGDDGAGAAALHALEAGWLLPSGIEALDLGTPGPYLAEMIRDFDVLIFLDTVRATGLPGEVVVVHYGEDAAPPPAQRLTPHAPDVGEALATLAFEDRRPDVTVVGVVPERLAAGTELSPAVRGAIDRMVALAAAELQRRGFEVRRRASGTRTGPWWERVQPFPA